MRNPGHDQSPPTAEPIPLGASCCLVDVRLKTSQQRQPIKPETSKPCLPSSAPDSQPSEQARPSVWTLKRQLAAVALLLVVPYALAVLSLTQENPTVDEVIHLPAGISYWETGRFRLYRHNPPLVKLVAAVRQIV